MKLKKLNYQSINEPRYVESIRKKADREKLRGFACNECKKFYDAIGMDSTEICNHVSRHRYKFTPSSSDSEYWNLDSIPSPLLATQYRNKIDE